MSTSVPYLPFDALLRQLRQHGFVMGPDVHLRVQQLLNAYASDEAYLDLTALRYQLGAIVSRSEAELRLFYSLFDDYVAAHATSWEELSESSSEEQKSSRPIQWIWGLLVIPLAFLLWYLFTPLSCPEGELVLIQKPVNSREQQRIVLSVNSSLPFSQNWRRKLKQKEGFFLQGKLFWDFGDGNSASSDDLSIEHTYKKEGDYPVRVKMLFQSGCFLTVVDTITVRKNIYLKPDFQIQEESNQWTFEDKSFIRDTPDSLQYLWEFGDGTTSTERSPGHRFPVGDSFEVKLSIRGLWSNGTDTTAVIQKPLSTLPRPTLARRDQDFLDEDLSHLIRNREPDFSLLWVLLSFLLCYWIIEVVLAWRRNIALDEAPERGPPFRQPLVVDAPALDAFHSREFYDLVQQLRRRRTGEESPRPDGPASARQTAEAGGFPHLMWKQQSFASQYLLLVEQISPKDHLAQLYIALAQELESRDISIEVYYYRHDPRICWRKHRHQATSLSSLLNQFPNYRLLIMGEGEGLLDESGQRLDVWTQLFEHWQERAWMSNKATESWGLTEDILAQRFVVVPSSQAGLAGLILQWEAEEPLSPIAWKRMQYQMTPPEMDTMDVIGELRAYLGPTALQWLAACAWYPELSWELSLRLGKGMESIEQGEASRLIDLDGLIHLFRLPCFRQGEMPRQMREALVDILPESQASAVREQLLQLLQQPINQPPADSYAAADQQVRTALYSFLNSKKSAADKRQLRQGLKGLEEEIEDHVSLHEINKLSQNPLALIVPARYFHGHLPFLGMRQRARLWMVSVPLLVGMILAFWRFGLPVQTEFDPLRSYEASELMLGNAVDSAMWMVHEGYAAHARDQEAEVRWYFDSALSLVRGTINLGSVGSGYPKAQNNALLVDYHDILELYQKGETKAALDGLNKSWDYIQNRNEYYSISDTNSQEYLGHFWIVYAKLMLDLIEKGYPDFYQVRRFNVPQLGEARVQTFHHIKTSPLLLCSDFYPAFLKDSLSSIPALRELLQLRAESPIPRGNRQSARESVLFADTTDHLSELLNCLAGSQLYEYEIRIRIGDDPQAATYGPSAAILFGSEGFLRVQLADESTKIGEEQFFSTPIYTLRELGPLTRIKLIHKDVQGNPNPDDWFVEEIGIVHTESREISRFYVEQWLGPRSGIWEIERIEGQRVQAEVVEDPGNEVETFCQSDEANQIIRLGIQALQNRNYELSINRFLDARNICINNKQIVDSLIQQVFLRIESERDQALSRTNRILQSANLPIITLDSIPVDTSAFVFTTEAGTGSGPCDLSQYLAIMNLIQKDLPNRDYQLALARLLDVRNICPGKKEEVDQWIQQLFDQIDSDVNRIKALGRFRFSIATSEDSSQSESDGASTNEVILTGQVLLLNSGKQPVPNAIIGADVSSPTTSDANGEFRLIFPESFIGESVFLLIEKEGYEVVNAKELDNVILTNRNPIQIILAPKGEIQNTQRRFSYIAQQALYEKYEVPMNQLRSNPEETMKTLSEKYGREIKNKAEARKLLNSEFELAKKRLPEIARNLSRVNLDDASESYIKAYEAFQVGKIDSAMYYLDREDTESGIDLLREDIIRIENAIFDSELQVEREISALILRAETYASLSDYTSAINTSREVLKAYQQIDIRVRKNEKHSDFLSQFGEYFYKAGIYDSAIFYLDIALVLQDDLRDQEGLGQTHGVLALVYLEKGDPQKAMVHQSESDRYLQAIFPQDHPKVIISKIHRASIHIVLDEFQDARRYQEEALSVGKNLWTEPDLNLASSYFNMGKIELNDNNKDKAVEYMEKAIDNVVAILPPTHQEYKVILGYAHNMYVSMVNDLTAGQGGAETQIEAYKTRIEEIKALLGV